MSSLTLCLVLPYLIFIPTVSPGVIVVDHVLPSTVSGRYRILPYPDYRNLIQLEDSFSSKPGERASNLDANLRLLTVLALQQNVPYPFGYRLSTVIPALIQGWQLFRRHFYRFYELDLHWVGEISQVGGAETTVARWVTFSIRSGSRGKLLSLARGPSGEHRRRGRERVRASATQK